MRIAVVGAGALGSVYGARLARLSDCDVHVVARAPAPPSVTRLECVQDGMRLEWAVPARLERTRDDAQAVVVCVRYEDLDAAVERIAAGGAPVVVMTPMMPQDFTRLSAAMPGRLVVAMPSILAYKNPTRTIRYWLPRAAATLMEAASARPGRELAEFAGKLETAGIAARLEPNVLTRNVATTMAILPLALAVGAAGGSEAALADNALLTLAQEAADEGRRLGSTFGVVEPWASILPRFVGPSILRAAAALTRAHLPETLTYIDSHFASKLEQQSRLLGARILELAKQKGAQCEAFEQLMRRLERAV
jgi:ketopantoate reductase